MLSVITKRAIMIIFIILSVIMANVMAATEAISLFLAKKLI
jgi:hypothetical protein